MFEEAKSYQEYSDLDTLIERVQRHAKKMNFNWWSKQVEAKKSEEDKDPTFTQELSDDEEEQLKKAIEESLKHDKLKMDPREKDKDDVLRAIEISLTQDQTLPLKSDNWDDEELNAAIEMSLSQDQSLILKSDSWEDKELNSAIEMSLVQDQTLPLKSDNWDDEELNSAIEMSLSQDQTLPLESDSWEDNELKLAIEMSLSQEEAVHVFTPERIVEQNISDEEQLCLAIEMSLQEEEPEDHVIKIIMEELCVAVEASMKKEEAVHVFTPERIVEQNISDEEQLCLAIEMSLQEDLPEQFEDSNTKERLQKDPNVSDQAQSHMDCEPLSPCHLEQTGQKEVVPEKGKKKADRAIALLRLSGLKPGEEIYLDKESLPVDYDLFTVTKMSLDNASEDLQITKESIWRLVLTTSRILLVKAQFPSLRDHNCREESPGTVHGVDIPLIATVHFNYHLSQIVQLETVPSDVSLVKMVFQHEEVDCHHFGLPNKLYFTQKICQHLQIQFGKTVPVIKNQKEVMVKNSKKQQVKSLLQSMQSTTWTKIRTSFPKRNSK